MRGLLIASTLTFACPPIDALNNIDELLLVVHCPVNFIIVSRPQVNHHVLVAASTT